MALRIIIGTSIAVFLVLVWALSAVYFSIKNQDEVAYKQSIAFVSDTVGRELRHIEQVAKDYSWWTDAYQNLAVDYHEPWAQTNIGRYLYDLHDIDLAAIISSDDRTLYAQIDGNRVHQDVSKIFSSGVGTLIRAARNSPLVGEPEPALGILSVGRDVALVGASVVTPEQNDGDRAPKPATILVIAKKLSAVVLGDIESRLPISDLRMDPDGSIGHWPLIDPNNERLASLDWKPAKPGSDFVRSVWPWALSLLSLVVFFSGFVLWYVQRTAARMEADKIRFRDVATTSSDWIWETDLDFKLTYLSKDLSTLTERPNHDWLDRPIDELFQPLETDQEWFGTKASATTNTSFRNLLCVCRRTQGSSDTERTLRVTGKPVHDARKLFQGYRGTATDITGEVEAQRRAEYAATHDSLTGLANRDLLNTRLAIDLAKSTEQPDSVAVICLDLDCFKDVNDILGHAAGDALLRQLAARLQCHADKSDMIARISGDEFAIIQSGRKQPEAAEALCTVLLNEMNKAFQIDGQKVFTTASFGFATAPRGEHTPTALELLQQADIALYEAKREGKQTWRRYDSAMDQRRQQRQSIEHDLRRACERQEFELFYQPIVSTADPSNILGAEALIRWHHPKRGLIQPEFFIRIAEETGSIMPLTEWVIWNACNQATTWPSVQLAVNVSPILLRQKGLVDLIRRALDETGLPPQRLEMEITEGMLLKSTDMSIDLIAQLKDIGVQIVIDDFGTGYSNLSYMQRFSIDKLKIDKTFLSTNRESRRGIVDAIVKLGHSLDMRVCAEGVEHPAQLAYLQQIRCDEAQGFYFGRPISAKAFATTHFNSMLTSEVDPPLLIASRN